MADMIASASTWLGRMRRKHAARPVIYCRDSFRVPLRASTGQSTWQVDREYGIAVITTRDFIVSTRDLILIPGESEPQSGDTIEQTIGTTTITYAVTRQGNEPCFRYVDPDRTRIRIHTLEQTNA